MKTTTTYSKYEVYTDNANATLFIQVFANRCVVRSYSIGDDEEVYVITLLTPMSRTKDLSVLLVDVHGLDFEDIIKVF